jgi:hypothetical protein
MHRLTRPMGTLLSSCLVALTLSAAGASASDGNQGRARERAALDRAVGQIAHRVSRARAPVRWSSVHPASVSGAPQLAYASYWGGSGAEGCTPTIGADGSIYVTCGTDSPNLPRIGGIQSHQGQEDGYIAKLDPTGRHIIYATYLGSPGQDEIDAAAVDRHGHVFVSGFAADGFPTTAGALDRTFNGSPDCCGGLLGDAFVAELSADGSRLRYATFLGGSGPEQAIALALAHDGSVVITGVTGSSDFPTTAGALEPSFGGGSGRFETDVPGDAFAAKLDPSGSRLIYST